MMTIDQQGDVGDEGLVGLVGLPGIRGLDGPEVSGTIVLCSVVNIL